MEIVHVLDEKQRALVLESGRVLVESNVTLRNVSKLIAWHGGFIEHLADQGAWGVLGFANQHEFRIAKGFSRSNWYRLVAIGLRFQKLDCDSYLAMSTENAERLGLEREDVRLDPENLRAAAEMKTSDFADYLVTKGAHAEGKSKSEKWAEWNFKLRAEQKKVMQDGLRGWMVEHELEDETFALELLIAEYRDRPAMTTFMLDAKDKLTQAIKETSDLSSLKLTVANHVLEMGHIIEVCCGEVDAA